MAFGSFDAHKGQRPVSEINMIPLIDVMLVLLIIFMITAPLMTHAVKIDLPKASSEPQVTNTEHIALAIAADGQLFWDAEQISRTVLAERLQQMAQHTPQPELHIHADQAAPYRFVAEALADAAQAGVTRIGFVSEPETATSR